MPPGYTVSLAGLTGPTDMLRRTLCLLTFAARMLGGAAEPLEDADLARLAAQEAAEPLRPKVIETTPANAATEVEAFTELRIRFDRPMDPLALRIAWDQGGFVSCGTPQYDAARHEFRIPVQLPPGTRHRLILNRPALGFAELKKSRERYPGEGFQSADRHLAALFAWQFSTRKWPAPASGSPPKPLAISPHSGSTTTPLTFIDVRFDRPMKPPQEAFPFLGPQTNTVKQASLLAKVDYDPARWSFRLPVLLPTHAPVRFRFWGSTRELPLLLTPNEPVQFTLDGFCDAEGRAAAPIPVRYRVSTTALGTPSRSEMLARARDPGLLAVLALMQQARTGMVSLAERVQVVEQFRRQGLFTCLNAQGAAFRTQAPGRFYGDVSQIMRSSRTFRVGCDGERWWFHWSGLQEERLTACPMNEMRSVETSFCDPFGLTACSPAQAAARLQLSYVGRTNVAGVDYHLIETWKVSASAGHSTSGSVCQWWVDARTGWLAEVDHLMEDGLIRTRYFCDAWNEPLPPESFALPASAGLQARPPEPLEAGFTNRFVRIHDGADGVMSLRWGKSGPRGSSDSGLN